MHQAFLIQDRTELDGIITKNTKANLTNGSKFQNIEKTTLRLLQRA